MTHHTGANSIGVVRDFLEAVAQFVILWSVIFFCLGCCSIREERGRDAGAKRERLRMSEIHGLGVHAAGAQLLPYKYDPGVLGANEVEIKISHCGVCFSDIHLIDNDWGISKYPFIPGHEIVGTVVAMGSGVKDRAMGERVGVGWQADSCGICEWCRQGDEHLCAKSQPTCVGRNGGFAEKIRVNSKFAIPVPEVLESENVAPLMCGGITVYSPLRNHGVRPSSRVGIVGIGGLGHLGVQFAAKMRRHHHIADRMDVAVVARENCDVCVAGWRRFSHRDFSRTKGVVRDAKEAVKK